MKAGIKFQSSRIAPVHMVQHENLSDCNCGRQGLELTAETSVNYVRVCASVRAFMRVGLFVGVSSSSSSQPGVRPSG